MFGLILVNEQQYKREQESHKSELQRLRDEHAAQLSERTRHELIRVEALQVRVKDLEERLKGETTAKEAAIDRLMFLGVGYPLYRQIPEQNVAPAADEGEPEEEEHPTIRQQNELRAEEAERNAANRNPRRMVRNTSMKDTILHNRRLAEDGVNAITREIEMQARKRAEAITVTENVAQVG